MAIMKFLLLISALFSITVCANSSTNDAQLAIIEPTLLVSTLDGGLYAVGQRSGLIKWTLQEEPIVRLPQMPNSTQNLKQPLFLPDPKDGSLYVYNGISSKTRGASNGEDANEKDALQKMPFTISELVSASPCKSSDGLLYTGRKVDSWLTIDGKSGAKIDVLNSDSPMCPKTDDDTQNEADAARLKELLFLGKSEYHLSIFDLKTRTKRWNITLIDYSASAAVAIPQSAYDMLHLTSSSSGRIVTFDLNEGGQKLLWSLQLGSPIVAVYMFNDGAAAHQTRRVPFTTVGDSINNPIASLDSLIPSVYIGESESTQSAYALSTNVDLKDTRVLSTKQKIVSIPQIEGPDAPLISKSTVEEYFRFIIYGFYEEPVFTDSQFSPQLMVNQEQRNWLDHKPNKFEVPSVIHHRKKNESNEKLTAVSEDSETNLWPLFWVLMLTIGSSIGFGSWWFKLFRSRSMKQVGVTLDNAFRIGKIAFDPKMIIGRGSAGTCVYQGKYEDKQKVAVKRIITDYFVLADREIELLRSLQHPNLVRYFATESDHLFRYIAIELAEFSLADYVEKHKEDPVFELGLSAREILYDSCLGLSHLHSVNVIHRDIKPQNILISNPLPPLGRRKVLITDFGVSKVLTQENSKTSEFISTTRVIKGTEGWIAPEVLKSKLDKVLDFRSSQPIDIFSMGCLFYYVYTNGKHPFGNPLERQSNILRNQSSLAELTESEEMIGHASLIGTMIAMNPGERPSINTVLCHPVFWDEARQLQFFQDLSDRIEKEPLDSDVVLSLERGGFDVVKGDWRRYLTMELQTDLRKFRAYKGSSVRDLLRALRNKRHHYRELPEDVQASLGDIPDGFVSYFTSRFPRLLYHAYIAMQAYKYEPIFRCYYDQDTKWDFLLPPLPRTGIRWFEINKTPKKVVNDSDTSKEEQVISLKPNGMGAGYEMGISWRSGSGALMASGQRSSSPRKSVSSSSPRSSISTSHNSSKSNTPNSTFELDLRKEKF